MPFTLLATLAVLWTTTSAQPPVQQPVEPVAALVQALERAATAGDREAIRAMELDLDAAVELAVSLTSPPPSRIVIRERDRTTREQGLRLLLEVFWERGLEGRLGTWTVDLVEVEEEWRIASATRVAHVTGLYRLAINRAKQYDVRNLTVEAPDLALTIPSGSAFVAETPDGVTGVVLLGDGRMRFAPPDVAERIQVRIFSDSEALETPFDAVFLRIRPEDFAVKFPDAALTAREPSESLLRRADEVFEEFVGRSLQINLQDLSPDRWSITPQPGDFIAEIRTRRFGVLTYTRSRNDAEDVTLFDRRRRRNISVYASAEKLATRGRFYNEDDLVDYDLLAHDLEVTIVPDQETIRGNARLKLKIRAAAVATINLRLAEELHVSGVYSPAYGRLLHLRVVNQNTLIVSLPTPAVHDTELWLNVLYSGKLPPQELEREAVTVTQDLQDTIQIPAEPRYIYSNRSYWYPQSIVTDFATVQMKITVPDGYDVLATGLPVGEPAPPPGVADEGPRMQRFAFESERPVRYLACAISRLRDVESRHINTAHPPEGVMLHTRANPRQGARARNMAGRAEEIFRYYAKIVGDVPYPSLTLAFTERDVPGGHSPAYFAVVDQPVQSGITWRNDPVNFDSYPSFFVAHEIAHQWWGQAVGWKNYHEQWLSEGFSQYFAALYAEAHMSSGVMANVLRQMRQTAMRQSSQGPIYLGYRLGHIKGDARVFRSIAYNKSAMVLHMLRRMIGDDAFFAGMRTFFAEWKFRKAGTSDLLATMEKASGRDLSEFFEAWVFGAAIPEARFSYTYDAQQVVLKLEQSGTPIEFPVTVRLKFRSGREADVVLVATGKVSERVIQITEPLRSAEANPDNGSLVRLR
jgi:hypothetical protein